MKRFLFIFIALVLISGAFLGGCDSRAVDREKTLKTAYRDLNSNFSSGKGSFYLISDYLHSWADRNGIKTVKSDQHYIILSNPANGDNDKKRKITLQCTIDSENFNKSLETMAIAQTALLGPESHGDISLIVTESSGSDFFGAGSVPEKYLNTDSFINLEYSSTPGLLTDGAEALTGKITSDLETATPRYSKAFNLKMAIPDHKDPYDFESDYPQPVKVLGNLLASQKSAGNLFQLSSFTCETTDCCVPRSASATVVVDENDIESFTSKFDKSHKKLKKRFSKLEDSFVYTMTETSTPAQVLGDTYSDNVISLLYTLKTGVYFQDEKTGEIISASYISNISAANNKLDINLDARSLDVSGIEEISGLFSTTSGLNNTKYNTVNKGALWNTSKETGDFFLKALSVEETENTTILKNTECDIFAKTRKDLNIISYRCNTAHGEAALSNILNYMEAQVAK